GPGGGGHPLRAGVRGHRRTGRGDAVLDGPVPLCLVSRFRDVPPGILGPDAPAPRRGRVATRLLTTPKGGGRRLAPITTGSRSCTSGRGSGPGGRTSSATRCSGWSATWRGRRGSTRPAGGGTTPAPWGGRGPRGGARGARPRGGLRRPRAGRARGRAGAGDPRAGRGRRVRPGG